MKKFKVWKTITIGGKSKEQLLNELENGGFYVSNWAKDIINKPVFTTAENPSEISLVRIKVRDLGFTEKPTTTQLFHKAKEWRLNLCPEEVGPHLRLNFEDQSLGDYFWVAMEPILGSGGYPYVFYVERGGGGGRWLDASCAHAGDRWRLDYGVVFCLRK